MEYYIGEIGLFCSTIMQEDVEIHMKKCPAVKQLDRFEHQSYHRKGINAGSDDDAEDADERLHSVKVCILNFMTSLIDTK